MQQRYSEKMLPDGVKGTVTRGGVEEAVEKMEEAVGHQEYEK